MIVNEGEAQHVRAIFALYLEHKALPPVLREIQQRQWTTKRWTTKEGRLHPGRRLEYQDLVGLLGNVIYAGNLRSRKCSPPFVTPRHRSQCKRCGLLFTRSPGA